MILAFVLRSEAVLASDGELPRRLQDGWAVGDTRVRWRDGAPVLEFSESVLRDVGVRVLAEAELEPAALAAAVLDALRRCRPGPDLIRLAAEAINQAGSDRVEIGLVGHTQGERALLRWSGNSETIATMTVDELQKTAKAYSLVSA